MAILQYSNGIIEDVKADDAVFTDEEILEILDGFKNIRTYRLVEVPNSWCVWGVNEKEDPAEFNNIGTGIVEEPVHSPLLIIHDSELDPSWNLNDAVILQPYSEFRVNLLEFIDMIAKDILDEAERQKKESGDSDSQMVLNTLGPTKDKKVLFEFVQDMQSKDFFEVKNLDKFSWKIVEYWAKHFEENISKKDNHCILYADNRIIIIIKDEGVDPLIDDVLIKHFESMEKYEVCASLQKWKDKWHEYKENPPPKPSPTKNAE